MPSFNQAELLEEAIVSVLEQNYPNLEIIALDGGSTDGSLAILEKYGPRFAYWRSRPDGGQLTALMDGFKMATGDLLGWVNSDDALLPGALWALAGAHTHAPDAGLIGGNYILIDKDGKVTRVKRHSSRAGVFARYGLVAINQPGSLVSRRAYESVGGFDPRFDFVMDTDLYFRILAGGHTYRHIDRWLSAFRIHSQAKTVAQHARAVIAGRQARASWFSNRRNGEARLAMTRLAYRLWQLASGNYVRSATASLAARGSNWTSWAEEHCKTIPE